MTLTIDDDEHDAFQAALTFVEEYAEYFNAQDEEGDASENSQHGSTSVLDLEEVEASGVGSGGLLFLEDLPLPTDMSDCSLSMVGNASVETQTQQMTQQKQIKQQRSLQKVSSKKNLIKKATKKTLKYNPNKARDERKEELIYLRKKVSELETQLEAVKTKRPPASNQLTDDPMHDDEGECTTLMNSPRLGSASSIASAVPLVVTHSVIPGMWQDIASRQSEERLKSERENIRLKLVLENQIKIAKSLEKILNRKQSIRELEKCVQGRHLQHVYAPASDSSDAELFASLLAGVDRSYAEIDAVFEANGLANIETTHSDARMRSIDSKGMFLEIFANKVLPFDMHATGTASWQHFIFAKQRTPYRYYYYNTPKDNADITEDTIVENFSLDLHANSTTGRFRYKQILKRFVEEDRIVIVWRAFFEPVEFSDEPFSGMRFTEKGYILVKKPTTIVGNYSLVKTCYIFTPHFTGDLLDGNHPKVGALTDFMLSTTAANINASHQMIENVLLEQAMKRSTS